MRTHDEELRAKIQAAAEAGNQNEMDRLRRMLDEPGPGEVVADPEPAPEPVKAPEHKAAEPAKAPEHKAPEPAKAAEHAPKVFEEK